MVGMKALVLSATLRMLVYFGLAVAMVSAQAHKEIRRIEIHSGWGGLGTPQNAQVIIQAEKDGFVSDRKRVAPELVNTLVAALDAARIPKPDIENLGLTQAWLKDNLASVEAGMYGTFPNALPSQRALFEETFADPNRIVKILPSLFRFSRTDDYPHVSVKVFFEDGSTIEAKTNSQYAFMIPWQLPDNNRKESYDIAISRAVSELMPQDSVNKERLVGNEFPSELAQAVMKNIEPAWKMLGVEGRAGDALKVLQRVYTIKSADINPYHNKEYGISWKAKGPHEMNLQAVLHRPDLPDNLSIQLILLYDQSKVEGVDGFLKTAEKYESLVLSVPWLNAFLRENPRLNAWLFFVHRNSFGDHAMQTFALDMKARGREDLIEKVRSQQDQIALLNIQGADWLVFPDKHMMLWRYETKWGLLKWTAADFPPGLCGAYPSNFGGCSGREVTPEGTLTEAHIARDQECMAQYQAHRTENAPYGDDLFPVMEHDRAGFIDRAGKIVIPLCFDKVGSFSEGLARFERDGNWGYINANGTVVIGPRFPWAKEFHEGLAKVQVTGRSLDYHGLWGFIDKTGKIVVAPDYETVIGNGNSNIGSDDDDSESFHEGLALVAVNDKFGFIDKSGKVVVPIQFAYALPFSEGLAAAAILKESDPLWGFVDRSGNWVIPPQFDSANPFSDHLAAVKRGPDCFYINPTGHKAHLAAPASPNSSCMDLSGSFAEGLASHKFGRLYGFIDLSGKTAIQPQFEMTYSFSEGIAAAKKNGKWIYIDQTGKTVIVSDRYMPSGAFHHGLAFVRTEDMRYGYIDRFGNFIWKPTFLYANTQ